jgi:hypothetical protein
MIYFKEMMTQLGFDYKKVCALTQIGADTTIVHVKHSPMGIEFDHVSAAEILEEVEHPEKISVFAEPTH